MGRIWMPDTRLMMPIGLGSRARPAGSVSTISSPTTAYRYDGPLTLTVPGTNLDPSTSISVDGVPYATTYVSPTAVTISIPGAHDPTSILRTASARTLTASTGGSASWTIADWTETDEAACTAGWLANPTNCNGASTAQRFSPWTDLNGVEDLANGGGTSAFYFPANHTGYSWNIPSVYVDVGFTMTRTAQTINGSQYFVVCAVNQAIFDGFNRTILEFDGGARSLTVPASSNVIRWTDTPNIGGAAAVIDTGTLVAEDNRAVYSIWRAADASVHMQRSLATEFTPVTNNNSGGTGGAMRIGSTTMSGGAVIPYISTWSSDPGQAVRLRARNKALIAVGLA